MKSQACVDAGSMPAEVLVHGTIVFDKGGLARAHLSDFQRKVTARLIHVMEALPAASHTSRLAIAQWRWPAGETVFVNIAPRQSDAAEMTIYIDRNESVYVGAGRDTTFGLPHDVYDPRARDTLTFTNRIVSAIIEGKLRETLFYRGHVQVKCKSELDIDGVPICVERLKPLRMLFGLLRKQHQREVTYAPYSGRGAGIR